MSSTDYYKLLEVSVTATAVEIKSAYRRLAKLYHPDKNTGYLAEEKFKQIKEAYETLINPIRRARYDSKRSRATTFTSSAATQQKKTERKSYSFTEEQAKQRKHYQQQYKKTSESAHKHATPKKDARQTELKYILISVPVAVALLLLIIRIYEKPAPKASPLNVSKSLTYEKSEFSTPESPYKGIFGKNSRDSSSLSVIKLMNRSGYDAVVFFENDSHKILRHHFIANNYQLLVENLPPATYRLYYWLGRQFSYKNFLFDTIMGNFEKSVSVDSAENKIAIQAGKADTIVVSLSKKNNGDTSLLKSIFTLKK